MEMVNLSAEQKSEVVTPSEEVDEKEAEEDDEDDKPWFER